MNSDYRNDWDRYDDEDYFDYDCERLGIHMQKLYDAPSQKSESSGYHKNLIEKGRLGELSKIQEELNEAFDAEQQDCMIMVLLELSDMIGALELYLKNYFPDMTIDDLISMANVTKRAFENGERQSK